MNYLNLLSNKPRYIAALALVFIPALVSAAPLVYIAAGDANSVLVVDTASDEVIAEIPGIENTHGLAGGVSHQILLAGSLNPRAPDTIPDKPVGMSEDDHNAHHGASGANPAANVLSNVQSVGTVYQIDIATRRILKQITVPGFVHHTLLTADGRYGIATHPTSGGISVIDMESGDLVNHIATGPVPNYAVTDSEESKVWVSNSGNNTISEIDTVHWIVQRNLIVGKAPEHMVLSADGSSLYVVETGDGTIAELDLASGKVVKRYPVGNDPHGVDISDDRTQLYVSVKGDNKLVAIQLGTGDVRTLPLTPAPYHLATIEGTGKLYVSSRETPKVWVISQQTMKVLKEVPIRGVGHQMVVLQGG